jgi:hypothetical protein
MRVTQTVASGVIIRQDFRTSARFVFFDTGDERWQYATHGGTMFVVLYKGEPYGLTCRHVLKDFDWPQLLVTDQRQGKQIAGVRSVAYPSQPKDAAIDTDLLDVAVIQFSDASRNRRRRRATAVAARTSIGGSPTPCCTRSRRRCRRRRDRGSPWQAFRRPAARCWRRPIRIRKVLRSTTAARRTDRAVGSSFRMGAKSEVFRHSVAEDSALMRFGKTFRSYSFRVETTGEIR